MQRASVPVYFAQQMLRNSIAQGLEPTELLRRSRISPRLLSEPGARISVPRMADLQTVVMLAMDDEGMGYEPRKRAIGTWSMMCHAVFGSHNLGQAISRYARFFGLFDFGLRPKLIEHQNTLIIRFQGASGEQWEYHAFAYEFAMFNMYRFLCWLIEQHLPLLAVNLRHPQPPAAIEYASMFAANPVVFGAEQYELVLRQPLMELRVRQTEAGLARYLRQPVLMMLMQRYRQSSWTVRVRHALGNRLESMPELEQVSSVLSVHPQTLRRRLAREGTTFKELKQQIRRDMALHHLGRDTLSIADIAERTGFSESSAFIRAFRGWTGTTPYTYRKGL